MAHPFSSKEVEPFLTKGEYFWKRQEGTAYQVTPNCLLKVDESGLFLVWNFSSQKETFVLECTHIREVKTGVNLKDIKAVFELGDADNNLNERVLTIYHGFEIGALSVTQIVASTHESAQKWVNGLNKLVHCLKTYYMSPLEIMKKQWRRLHLSLNQKGMIPVRRLVKHFAHDKVEKAMLQKLKNCGFTFTKNDEINPDDLTFELYKTIHRRICFRDDIDDLFKEITNNKSEFIELSQFVKWLNDNQRDPRLNEILVPTFDEKAATNIIQKYETCSKNCKNNRLSKQGFYDYLSSHDNCLVYKDHVGINHDMDQPLCHYFINSSHNTYLPGRQIGGKSSVDIYRHVLLSGCRCIELDCWDGKGEMHGEPIITHGKAMCTDVLFKNVLYAIRDAAFVTSEFPVILSFETHCSKPQQLKMAKYCEEVFGDLLLSKNMDAYPLEPGIPLPSPNALKRKILIKNKRLDSEIEKAQLENLSRNEVDFSLDEETEEAHPELRAVKSNDVTITRPSQPITKLDTTLSSDDLMLKPSNNRSSSRSVAADKTKNSMRKGVMLSEEDEQELLVSYEHTKTSFTNIHPYLSSLVNYCQSVKFPGFKKVEEGESQKLCYQMSSFSENVGLNFVKSNAIDFVNYNKCQLSRIYPRGNRVDSSNYMPQIFWNAGCQLVSLNFQTCDLGMQLNSGKFDLNGKCGYLLKPDVLLHGSKMFDPFAESTMDGVIAAQCGVKVISAQFLSDKPISSYVEVDMYGLPNDTIRKEFRTSIAMGNGLNPQYNNEFLFRKVICPDLALIRFTLYDDGRQLIGQRVIPLNSLQTGYRYVALHSTSDVPLHLTTIFVKITLKSYVPDNLLVIASALENPKAHQMSLLSQHEQQLKCFEDEDAENGQTDKQQIQTKFSRKSENSNSSDNDETPNNKSTNNKSMNKEKLTSQHSSMSSMHTTLYAKKSEEKKVMEDVIEQASVSMEMLESHPIYLKAVELHKKECNKIHKKLEKVRSIQEKKQAKNVESDEENHKVVCCLHGLISARRRSKSNNNCQVKCSDGVEPLKLDAIAPPSIDSMCPDKKRSALLSSLNAIHEETLDGLKKTLEKEMNELTQGQTKKWMENSKQISKNKSIPPAERERRIRDLKSMEVKNFMEERQTLKNRHGKQLERLESVQQQEADKIKKVIEAEVN